MSNGGIYNINMCALHFSVTFCFVCMYQIMCEYVCVYVRIIVTVCNCTHERTNKISCILFLARIVSAEGATYTTMDIMYGSSLGR